MAKINIKTQIFVIYPEAEKPEWMEVGAWCYCLGEAYDIFYVEIIGKNAAFLKTKDGRGHGWESFTKLHRKKF